ncbi:hypothetical protein KIL84_007358 [Mauremys mutica]|uniref:Uncharacterized protein n=1 Tax=Mauremys mutica TaxID=74926 RepID=A0A9D3X378_9SAUR|nr:hypothetical protein KIL84_007358 [Mauremys mutica]
MGRSLNLQSCMCELLLLLAVRTRSVSGSRKGEMDGFQGVEVAHTLQCLRGLWGEPGSYHFTHTPHPSLCPAIPQLYAAPTPSTSNPRNCCKPFPLALSQEWEE